MFNVMVLSLRGEPPRLEPIAAHGGIPRALDQEVDSLPHMPADRPIGGA